MAAGFPEGVAQPIGSNVKQECGRVNARGQSPGIRLTDYTPRFFPLPCTTLWYILLPIEYGYDRQREIPANTTRTIREHLGVTQAALAAMLGVSPKAVQSYEQGWRKVPWHLLSQMLLLLALQRRQDLGRPPCWELTGCSRRGKSDCPSPRFAAGRYCWLAAGTKCGHHKKMAGKAVPCATCVVIANLLRGAAQAAPVARAPRRAARAKANLSGRCQRKRRSAEKSEVTS